MKLKSVEIKTELDKTKSKIKELNASLETSRTAFEKSQKSFVAGKCVIEDLQAEQSKLNALSQTVEMLQTTAQRLSEDYEQALEGESRRTALNGLKTVANDAQSALTIYLDERRTAAEALKRAVDSFFAFRDKQEDFATAFRSVMPQLETFNLIPKESRIFAASKF